MSKLNYPRVKLWIESKEPPAGLFRPEKLTMAGRDMMSADFKGCICYEGDKRVKLRYYTGRTIICEPEFKLLKTAPAGPVPAGISPLETNPLETDPPETNRIEYGKKEKQ